MKKLNVKLHLQQLLSILFATVIGNTSAFSTPAQTPLELQQISAKPNVMLLLDNSGSMNDTTPGTDGKSKLDITKEALASLIDNRNDGSIRFCGATFSHYGDIFNVSGLAQNGYLLSNFGAGAYMDEGMQCGSSATSLTQLKNSLNRIIAQGDRPLAEAYYDITRYFRNMGPYFGLFKNRTSRFASHSANLLPGTANSSHAPFADPIQLACQTNTVILITDGLPTTDWDEGRNQSSTFTVSNDPLGTNSTPSLPDWDSDQSSPMRHSDNTDNWHRYRYIDDLVKFGMDIDLKSGSGFDSIPYAKQNLKTHIIGLNIDDEVLSDAASYGAGNYYQANSPQQLTDSLQDALNNIMITGVGKGAGTSGVTLAQNNKVDYYVTSYESDVWSGDLSSFSLSDSSGSINTSKNWAASEKMPAHQARKLFTRKYLPNSNRNIAVEFNLGSLTAGSSGLDETQIIALGSSETERIDLINYIRGDVSKAHSNEANNDLEKAFRYRRFSSDNAPLGDIVHSTPRYVQNEVFNYPDLENSNTYSEYKQRQKNRTPVVYVGANDGFLHAFNAETGVEIFGFIPDTFLSRIEELSNIRYDNNHRFFVDGTPIAIDAKLSGDWGTVYSSPFGAGAKGLFSLNITDPAAGINDLLLWEANESTPVKSNGNPVYRDMGYILTQPKIGRVMASGMETWVLITGNGVDSVDGKSFIYIINLDDGSLRQKISIPGRNMDNATPIANGVTSVVAADLDNNSFIDRLYATTLEGEVWRLDYDDKKSEFGFVLFDNIDKVPLFIAKNNNDESQAITAAVTVTKGPVNGQGVLVSFGTGKFFDEGDVYTKQIQSFYSVWDKYEHGKDKSNSFTPHKRNDLLEQVITNTGASRESTSNNVDYTEKDGWYMDLIAPGERIISQASAIFERIAFNTISFDIIDKCGGEQHAWFMQLERKDGKPPSIPKAFFAGQTGKSGVTTTFTTQEPIILQGSDGTLSYPTIDRDGNVDQLLNIDFDYYRSSWRRLQ